MRRISFACLAAFGTLALASCSSEPAADNAVAETKMDSVDAVQGTISDEMIVTDDVSDQAPIADAEESSDEKSDDAAKGKKSAKSEKKVEADSEAE